MTALTYRGYCEKHDDELLLGKDWMSNEGVCEPH